MTLLTEADSLMPTTRMVVISRDDEHRGQVEQRAGQVETGCAQSATAR